MKLLPRTDLSPLLLRALTASSERYFRELQEFLDNFPEPYDYQFSVTTLSSSPREKELTKRHWDEIELDPMYFYYTLFGSGVHNVMENQVKEENGEIMEKRVGKVFPIDGKRVLIHGQFDFYTPENGGILEDHKYTSVWVMFRERFEHTAQLNVLRLLCDANDIKVKYLRSNYLFRDWRRGDTSKENYPQHQAMLEDKEKWSRKQITEYVMERGSLCLKNRLTANENQLTECTDEETWKAPVQYKAYKIQKDGKVSSRAYRVKPTKSELVEELLGKSDYKIVETGGERKKCEEFCLARPFCNQYKAMKNGDNTMPLL